MYKQILVLTLLTTWGNAQLEYWNDCGTKNFLIENVVAGGCQGPPCTFAQGGTYALAVTGVSLVNSTSYTYTIVATYSDVFFETLLEGNGCNDLIVGYCPANPGASLAFFINYSVPTSLPTINGASVIAQVVDNTGAVDICIEISANLVGCSC